MQKVKVKIMNKWVGIGRLVADAELRFTQGKGTPVSTFKLAIDDGYGENKKTDFIPVVLWGKSAENLANYLNKGTLVAVSGKVSTRSYAKDGSKKYITEITADMFGGVKLLGRKISMNQDSNGSNNFGNSSKDVFGGGSFDEDITPVDDDSMPF